MYWPEQERIGPGGHPCVDPVGIALTHYAGKRKTEYTVRGMQLGQDEDDGNLIWVVYGDARTGQWDGNTFVPVDEHSRVFWLPEGPDIDPAEIDPETLEGCEGLTLAKKTCERGYRLGSR